MTARRAAPASFLALALQALARREYTRAELRQKLLARASADACKAQQQRMADAGEGARASETRISEVRTSETRTGENAAAQDAASRIDAVLDDLQVKGLLSDERAAASAVRQKAARYGNARIRRDLQNKGVDKATAEALLDEADDEWTRALALWRSRFGEVSDASDADDAEPFADRHARDAAWQARQKQRAKQARFMLGRGFSPAIVRRLLDGDFEE